MHAAHIDIHGPDYCLFCVPNFTKPKQWFILASVDNKIAALAEHRRPENTVRQIPNTRSSRMESWHVKADRTPKHVQNNDKKSLDTPFVREVRASKSIKHRNTCIRSPPPRYIGEEKKKADPDALLISHTLSSTLHRVVWGQNDKSAPSAPARQVWR